MVGFTHFDSSGWLTPIIDPYDIGTQASQSPEAQAFVVMMQAAWTNWTNDGSKGANFAPPRSNILLGLVLLSLFEGVVWFVFI